MGPVNSAWRRPLLESSLHSVKITRISTLVVHARSGYSSRWKQNESGFYGWGEATLEWKTNAVAGAVEDLAVRLIGQDPLRR